MRLTLRSPISWRICGRRRRRRQPRQLHRTALRCAPASWTRLQRWGRGYSSVWRERREWRPHKVRLSRTHPQRLIDVRRQSMDDRLRRLDGTMRTRLLPRERSNSATLRLEALSPLRVLAHDQYRAA